jgi:hypothetical protein
MLTLLLAFTLWPWHHASTSPLDAAGRAAFSALRDYHAAELAAYQPCLARTPCGWPTPAQHAAITVKLHELHLFVEESLELGTALPPGKPSTPQVASLVRHAVEQTQALTADTAMAPPAIKALLAKVQAAFLHLEAQFPPPGALESAPPRAPTFRP